MNRFKLILTVFIITLFIPLIVKAETCDTNKISISSISLKEQVGTAIETDSATAEGKNINLNLSMSNLGDSVQYEVVIKNDSNKDYQIGGNNYNSSDYISYNLSSSDNSNIIKGNSSKTFNLKIEYNKEIPEESFESKEYNYNKTITINLSSGDELINPNTKVNSYIVILVLVACLSGVLYFILSHKKKVELIILIIGAVIIIPLSVYALCKCDINIESNIIINNNSLYREVVSHYGNDDTVDIYEGEFTELYNSTSEGVSYYFKGEEPNNNIIFGGFCWQIVRTTTTKGVKVLYNGPAVDGKCNTVGEDKTIGEVKFNEERDDITYVGYMYNRNYSSRYTNGTYFQVAPNDYVIVGKDVSWDGEKYTLVDTIQARTISQNYHYTCANKTGECEKVRFYYYGYTNYLELSNGETPVGIINDMLMAEDVNEKDSSVKAYIEDWFENNMLDYVDYLEDVVYCNNRSLINYGGFANDSPLTTRYLAFNSTGFKCPNETDRFSVGNSKAPLKYPVGMLTISEADIGRTEYYWDDIDYYYLSGAGMWLMSPSYRDIDGVYGNSKVYVVSGSQGVISENGYVQYEHNVRPVVSLKPGTKYISGDGSKDNPYIIKE